MPVSGNYGTSGNPNGDIYSSYWELQWYTGSDPAHVQGDMWGRSDLTSGDRIATIRVDHYEGSGVWDIPILPTGGSDVSVEEVSRIPTPNGRGFVPITNDDNYQAQFQQLKYVHDSTHYSFHDDGSAVPYGAVHLDATQLSLSDGSTVSPWPDVSGNNNDLAAVGSPQYAAVEIGGNASVTYDGTDDVHNISPFSQSLSVELVIVARFDDLSARSDLVSLRGPDTDVVLYYDGTDSFNLFAGSVQEGPSADTSPHIFDVVWRSGADELIVDGVTEISADAGNSALGRLTIGAGRASTQYNNFMAGDIGEVYYFASELTAGQRDALTNDLSSKWGISV